MKNKAAIELNRIRWSRIPKKERAQHVPHNGGRKRKYPVCTRKYKNGAHRFHNNRCPCGYTRPAED